MITGKNAIVTGASRGIGREIALRLASEGVGIAAIYAGHEEKALEVCRICREEYGVKAIAFRCDVSDFEMTKKTVSEIKSDFNNIQILINNAGITRDGLLAMMKKQDFDDVISTNLTGAFNMIRHCTRLFLSAKEGCIINISSVSGIMGNAGQANYSASKAGLIGLTKSVARELAPKNIRCSAIAPGFIRTDMTSEQGDNPMLSSIPLGRMGECSDVADAAVFLAKAEYITGEVLRVDGGIAM